MANKNSGFAKMDQGSKPELENCLRKDEASCINQQENARESGTGKFDHYQDQESAET